jgi:hypothetical protein
MFCDKIFCAEKFVDIYQVVAHQLILTKSSSTGKFDFSDFSILSGQLAKIMPAIGKTKNPRKIAGVIARDMKRKLICYHLNESEEAITLNYDVEGNKVSKIGKKGTKNKLIIFISDVKGTKGFYSVISISTGPEIGLIKGEAEEEMDRAKSLKNTESLFLVQD